MIEVLKKEFAELDTSDISLRKFGIVVGAIALLILWVWFRDAAYASYCAAAAATLIILGALYQRPLLYPYYLWMGFALLAGQVVSTVLFAVLYYGLVTPLALMRRVVKGRGGYAKTNWVARPEGWSKESMERQF